MVDCTPKDECPIVAGERVVPWSQQHEALYWRGVEEIFNSIVCENNGSTGAEGGKLAYHSDRPSKASCADPGISTSYLATEGELVDLLQTGKTDSVIAIERYQAFQTNLGISVQVSIIYLTKPDREGITPKTEGIDTYLIVQSGKSVEVRLESRLKN